MTLGGGTIGLGFNARISFPTGRARDALREGIELFRVAEQLGYDTGWVYQRHFDNYLAAPLPFLTAAGEHTDRIGLGTAIIGARYEDPVLLAEAAGTTDLLTGDRLQVGLGTGQGGYDALFGQEPSDGREQARRRLAGFVAGVRGEPLGTATDPAGMVAPGTPLRVTPHSPTLAGRIWYGAGSVASARFTGEQGLRLLMSTILSGAVDDFGAELAAAIDAYHRAHVGPFAPRAAVARSVLPATTPGLARTYATYDAERRRFGPAASRPAGALPPVERAPARFTMSPVLHGDPAAVVDALLADPSVAIADELICFLPPAFGLKENIRLLEDVAEHVAPQLAGGLVARTARPA
jgi:alkanesulfonate monooxygenase SsuD/methylene tetrahydromethanopterin reductase-like flavin-dependent oxidoreductase (luciferase family)